MNLPTLRRNRKTQFARAADGSMTLMEHLYELRDRLFRAWFVLGWPAFGGLVVVFFLMVLKPSW